MLENMGTKDYIEEVKVEDLYILVDRFGYTKSIDAASYQRLGKETLKEYVHQVPIQNTDKLCLFTAEGNMYQIKVSNIPRCKIRDKGTLIHNLCKVGKEDILLFVSFEALFESMLFFATKDGYVKLVSGAEFETIRSCIATTKLADGDKLVGIDVISAHQLSSEEMKVILYTEKGVSLGYLLNETSEFKKGSRGVKGIALDANDRVAYSCVVGPDVEEFIFEEKRYSAKKVRMKKRGAKGTKSQIQI